MTTTTCQHVIRFQDYDGTAAYAITFLAFAVNRDERQVYLAKATELLRSRWREPAAA